MIRNLMVLVLGLIVTLTGVPTMYAQDEEPEGPRPFVAKRVRWTLYRDGEDGPASKFTAASAEAIGEQVFAVEEPRILVFRKVATADGKGFRHQRVFFSADRGSFDRNKNVAMLEGEVIVRLLEESDHVTEEMIEDDVRVLSDSGTRLLTNTLTVDFISRHLRTDEPVRFYHPTARLEGTGIVGRDDLQDLTIVRDITGEITGDIRNLADYVGEASTTSENPDGMMTRLSCDGPLVMGRQLQAGFVPTNTRRMQFFENVRMERVTDEEKTSLIGNYVDVRIEELAGGGTRESMLVTGEPRAECDRNGDRIVAREIRILNGWREIRCTGEVESQLTPDPDAEPWRISSETLAFRLSADGELEKVRADLGVRLELAGEQGTGRAAVGSSFVYDPVSGRGALRGDLAEVREGDFRMTADEFRFYPEAEETELIGRKDIYGAETEDHPGFHATADGVIRLNAKTGRITLDWNGKVTYGDRSIEAGHLMIDLDPEAREPKRLIGMAGVRIRDAARKDELIGERCTWSPEQHVLSVEGEPDAELVRPEGIMRANVIEIDTETGRFHAMNAIGVRQQISMQEAKDHDGTNRFGVGRAGDGSAGK